jgi:flavin reductase (DIM6/NTAB) family NADH-FMN oxidoreductase RutF
MGRTQRDRKPLRLSHVYRLLEPGPVVLLATSSGGRPNVMPMSWHTMIDFEPPLVGCVVSDRNHTFETLKATREGVIAIPTADLGRAVVGCGNVSGRRVDKFRRFGLTPVAASRVAAPLVAECWANLECRVVDASLARKYDLFVLEVVAAWVDPRERRPRTLHHLGGDRFMVAGETIRLPSRKP